MTKLPIISSKQVISALRAAGFKDAPKRGKGSHTALVKRDPEKIRLVIVPESKALPRERCMPLWINRDYRDKNL